MLRIAAQTSATVATVIVGALALATAQPAAAANTRVSISNFAWSSREVHINLDEKVTWDWLGPDLAHSVTGISADALQWDSDPNTDAPDHRPGDSYTIQFSQPGTYSFECKLHAFVGGEVIVSPTPGDPNSDPGPQAPLKIDVVRPTLGGVKPKRSSFRGSKGVTTTAHISERGELEANYYRVNSRGKRVYNGYATWKAFIGVNRFALGARAKHFKARPGTYVAVLRTTDPSANVSKPVSKRFVISASPRAASSSP